jgi:hypothetical protein
LIEAARVLRERAAEYDEVSARFEEAAQRMKHLLLGRRANGR